MFLYLVITSPVSHPSHLKMQSEKPVIQHWCQCSSGIPRILVFSYFVTFQCSVSLWDRVVLTCLSSFNGYEIVQYFPPFFLFITIL